MIGRSGRLVLLLLAASAFAAKRHISATDTDEITDTINGILTSHSAYRDSRNEYLKLRESIPEGQESSAQAADLEQAWQLIEKKRLDVEVGTRHLMARLDVVYGVNPHRESGVIQDGPLAGTIARWNPVVACEDEYATSGTDRNGNPVYVGATFKTKRGRSAGATTLANGDVLIPIQALEDAARKKNPDWLASSVYHESVHYSELLSKGGWDSLPLMEYRAHGKVLDRSGDFRLDEGQVNAVRRLRSASLGQDYLSRFISFKNIRIDPFPTEREQGWAKLVYQKEEEIRSQQARLRKRIEDEEADKRYREEIEERIRRANRPLPRQPLVGESTGPRPLRREPLYIENPAPPPQRGGTVGRPIAGWSALPILRQLAAKACAEAGRITQTAIDSDYNFPPTNEPFSPESSVDLSGCAKELFFELAERNRIGVTFDANWLNQRALSLRPTPSPPQDSGYRSVPAPRSPKPDDDPCRTWDSRLGRWIIRYPCP